MARTIGTTGPQQAKLAEFIGVQVGSIRLSEHAESINKRRNAAREGEPQPEREYALWGCGNPTKRDYRKITLAQVKQLFDEKPVFYGG